MAHLTPRISEARIDALFAQHLPQPAFGAAFLKRARLSGKIASVDVQQLHPMGRAVSIWC